MTKVAVAVIGGNLLAGWVPQSQIIQSLQAILLAGLAIASVCFRLRKDTNFTSFLFVWSVFLLSANLTWLTIQNSLDQRVFNADPQTNRSLSVTIVNYPVLTNFSQRVYIRADHALYVSYWPDDVELLPGQNWQVNCHLRPIAAVRSPGAFDPASYYFAQGVDGSCQVSNPVLVATNFTLFQQLKQEIRQQLAHWPIDISYKAQIIALLTGEKDLLSQDQKNRLRDSHTQHLLVVSGLHLGLLFGLIFLLSGPLLKLLGLQYVRPVADGQWLLGLIAAFIYAGICDFSVPTKRALIMLAVPAVLHWCRYPVLTLRTMMLALISVLLLDPMAMYQSGTWLSFGAVTVLLVGLGQYRAAGNNWTMAGIWHRIIKPQWLLSIALLPVLWSFGQGLNWRAGLTNLVAVPLVSIVLLPGSIFMVVAHELLPPKLIYWIFDIYQNLWRLLEVIQTWGQTGQSQILPPESVRRIWPAGIAIFLLPGRIVGKFLLVLVFILTVIVLVSTNSFNQRKGLSLWVMDTGQGQSVLVGIDSHFWLVDTGPGEPDNGGSYDRVVRPMLNELDIRALDGVIISHMDADHSSGLTQLASERTALNWLFGEPPSQGHNQCQQGQVFRAGNHGQIEILSPIFREQMPSGNAASCVVKISYRQQCVLIPGDIGKRLEYWLMQQDSEPLDCQVLIAGHHGSRSSTSRLWLNDLSPELVIFSQGRYNRFGHPDRDLLDYLDQQEIAWVSTAEKGSFRVDFNNDELELTALRKLAPYWLQQHAPRTSTTMTDQW